VTRVSRTLAALLAVLVVATASQGYAAARRLPPGYADPSTTAATAGPAYTALAKRPTARWVTSSIPTGQVRRAVAGYVDAAAAAHRTPELAIYAIPARDCGDYSAGGLTNGPAYRAWIRQVAAGLAGTRTLVVLEPDALPQLGACRGQGHRARLLRWATKRLARAGGWVYLDAGHSTWVSPRVMATRLKRAGVARARGFSTNVSNFRPTGAEKRYARRIVRALRGLGVHGVHYVVDTSRNGAHPAPAGSDWCNPVQARVGAAPRLVFRGAFDGRLWVKHPGESDGPCHGGPAAGAWCALLADRLLGRDPTESHC
jgi:endoglucanase